MTPSTTDKLALRAIDAADDAFVFEVFSATRAAPFRQAGLPESVIGPLLEQQYRAQQSQYRAQFPGADFDLVMVDGVAVGYVYALRGLSHFALIDVALLPAHCGQGIGSRVVGALIAEADAAGLCLSAHVAKGGRAWRLWQRLGFEVVGDDGVYLAIERRPVR
ncbi:GNAT family N-acetyltransferase [Denitromonas halophila]|nr:GNAT family N-acetyltransferase [Denitromonas halophila]